MTSLKEKQLDFNTLEKDIYRFCCTIGIAFIERLLLDYDQQLAKNRDTKKYRHKGYRSTSIKTIMGTVEVKRTIYEVVDNDGKKKYVYLLDEFLNLKTIGKISTHLAEQAIKNATVASYRQAASNVTELTCQSISHGAIWNLIQELGMNIEQKEQEEVQKYKTDKSTGEKVQEVIFEEADGLWLNMQRKDRPKKGRSRKREIKLAVFYEGWEKRNQKKEAYQVINKKVVAGFMKADAFKELRDSTLAQTYNVDEINFRILNGDGASWIKQGHDCEGDYFQLDKFHIFQSIIRKIPDKKESSNLINLIKQGEVNRLFERLIELKYESGGECCLIEKIEELEKYLKSNVEGILPYQSRVTLPKPPDGIVYRNLGTMEHNVFDVLGHRMKGRKMSWSIKGANHLAKILAAKASGKLYETIHNLCEWRLPERVVEEFTEVIKNTKENIDYKQKTKQLYPVHEVSLPFDNCSTTFGRKAIRKIFNEKLATELIIR